LAGPDAWLDIARTLKADALRNPAMPGLAVCLFLALSYWQFRFRAKIGEIGEKASRANCYRFLATLETLLLTLMISAVWPGVLWYFGWRLSTATDASELCKVVGAGLIAAAQVYLLLECLRQMCRTCGLAESHFGWSAGATKPLRHNLRWLSLPLLPAVFVAVAMSAQVNDRWNASLGRLSFMAVLLLTALFLQRILRPNGGVVQAVLVERQGGWLDRFRYVWYPLGVLTPPALATIAAIGYYYTSQQLAQRLMITVLLMMGVILVRALLLRWTLVNQRRIGIEQSRQRRSAAQNEPSLGDESPIGSAQAGAAMPGRDLASISSQTRRLVGYSLTLAGLLGVWCIWVNVLPALRMLHQYEVWHTDDPPAAASAAVNPTGLGPTNAAAKDVKDVKETPAIDGKKHPNAVTLADLLLAVVVVATVVIAAKNIPGLLEMVILQHLPLDAGARYALATVSRYVITIIGVVSTCELMGLGWSKVQWLVAAMGLGLGFGLQEIFANFISGLIILFEQPVRVGDVITIDNISGVVSRIRLRTTTVTDWDRKELIIPNKEFITGRVLNWTLSDPVNRVVINVGIAYGSDTQRTAEILQKLAQEHPIVLSDPPPRVTLESFGDSALNFVLCFFLPNLENRGAVIHETHMAIDRAFREAGIEIAYPQQDVHVRSVDVKLPSLNPLNACDATSWTSTANPAPPKDNDARRAA
jgi:potassium efflux system protein